MRLTLSLSAAAATLLLAASPAPALMIAFKPPYQRALTAESVVVGKVTAIEKETVEVQQQPGGPKTTYHVAVVKVENAIRGAAGLTHIKVGFIPVAEAPNDAPVGGLRRPIRRGMPSTELKVGEEWLLFLGKHPTAGFQVMAPMSPPLDLQSEEGKKQLDVVKKAAAVLADPMKSLKAEKPEDRFYAASILLMKYRAYPDLGGKVVPKPIEAEESQLILKGLLDGDWTKFSGDAPNGSQSIGLLGLGPKEGFKYPVIKPGQNPAAVQKEAFATWLAGPGKDYVVKQNVTAK